MKIGQIYEWDNFFNNGYVFKYVSEVKERPVRYVESQGTNFENKLFHPDPQTE
jgi:hypothetical protein